MGTPLAFLPILMMLVGAMGVGALLLGLNYVVGRKVRTKRKLSPYESGMPLLDDSHKRISVKFFIVAMMFILFDVEASFLYPWAVVFRRGGRGRVRGDADLRRRPVPRVRLSLEEGRLRLDVT